MQLAGHILLGLAVLCSLVLGLATWASWVEDKDFREDLMEFAAQVIPPLAFLILGAYYSGQKD